MSKHDPSEKDLGFNPYIFDQETHYKLNHSHYAVDNVDHRRRINKWKAREEERKRFAEQLGVTQVTILTPVDQIIRNKNPK